MQVLSSEVQGEWPTRNKYGNCLCCMKLASANMQFWKREAPTAASTPCAPVGTMAGRDGWQFPEPIPCPQALSRDLLTCLRRKFVVL